MTEKIQAQKLAKLGRYEDSFLAHVAEDEMVIPSDLLKLNPDLKNAIYKEFRKIGLEPSRFRVGSKANSINPKTGLPEFFIKGIRKIIKDILPGDSEKYLGEAVGILTGNPLLAAGASGYFSPGIGSLGQVAKFGAGTPLSFLTGAGKTAATDFSSFLFGDTIASGSAPGRMTATQGVLGSGGQMSFKGGSVGEAVTKVTDKLGLTGAVESQVKGEVGKNMKKGLTFEKALQLALITKLGGDYLKSEIPTDEEAMPKGLYETIETDRVFTGFDKPTPISYAPVDPRVFVKNGGLMSLAEGGFPRKNGEIEGPGTETSDDIPAMLSDGEFVVNARTVRGLGSLMGGKGKAQERSKGAELLYNMQNQVGGRA
jgi:hypothetical protein